MATVPNPKTWVDDTIPTAGEFNTHLRDVVSFLINPPRVVLRHNTDVPISHATWEVLPWATEVVDTDSMHDGGSNTLITAQTDGIYEVKLTVFWEETSLFPDLDDPNGARIIQVRREAGGSSAGGDAVAGDYRHHQDNALEPSCIQSCFGYVRLNATDTLEAFAWHNQETTPTGADRDLDVINTIGTATRFSAIWVAE
jgi:hypothetical protein